MTEGRETREEVEHAEEFWHDRLRSGVHLPNGDLIQIRRAVHSRMPAEKMRREVADRARAVLPRP